MAFLDEGLDIFLYRTTAASSIAASDKEEQRILNFIMYI